MLMLFRRWAVGEGDANGAARLDGVGVLGHAQCITGSGDPPTPFVVRSPLGTAPKGASDGISHVLPSSRPRPHAGCADRQHRRVRGGSEKDPPCTISPSPAAVGETYVVSVSGLPTGVAINLWITDPSGSTSGSPLGSTGDGSLAPKRVANSAGSWKYSFSGPTKDNPSPTVVYSSCSVEAY
jgi:hypothetical protein